MKERLPAGRMVVIYDDDTGVIHRTFRGSNFEIEPSETWGEVTEDKNVLQMFANDGQRKWLYCNKRCGLVKKARVWLEVTNAMFEAQKGKALIKLHREGGDARFNTEKVKVRINSKVVELAPGEEMELTSAVPNRLTVKVEDDRVFVDHDPPVIMATPARPSRQAE